ncbi:ExeM/NucH family extracellular endonuclease [Synechocystis sp. LKSZ1]|uniref:ExeM/NucH family extracellular endonuclease n=1 Tax=Synechocystis sp. LKSZ1 TaxID=3144951 RepID=UPI00336BCD02
MNTELLLPTSLINLLPAEVALVKTAVIELKTLLQELAQEEERYYSILTEAFGSHFDGVVAESIRTQWASGDFSQAPAIEIWSGGTGVILGAYSSEINRIYLAQWVIDQGQSATLANVLLEEIGHSIDAQINTSDTPGDEGQLFSELVRGNILRDEQLAAIKSENDWQTITIADQKLTVETAAFTAGNLVIYRVGTGSGSLVNTGNEVFLDEYTPAGALVQSIALPTTTSGTMQPLIASGTATSEGLLTLSVDGKYLLLTGYGTTTGGSSLSGTLGTSVSRVVARVDASGNIDTSTALTDFASGNNPRSVASTNGTDLWVAGGAGGVRYTTLGSTTSTQLSTTVTNIRAANILGGQLYISTSSGSTVRLGTVGTGTPTTSGQTITNLPGFPTNTGSPYGFFFADLDGAPGLDTLYVADDTANQIQKYALVAGSWAANGIITATAVRGLTGSVSGTTVTLYGTTGGSGATGGGSLYKFVDSTGYNATASGTATTIATAANNTAFRGVAFAPVAPPNPTINLSINDVSLSEGNADTTTYTFTVSLSAPAGPGGVTFDIATSDNTANSGSDYIARSLTSQTIPAGSSTYSFSVLVNGDTTIESNETFFVNVTNVIGANVVDGQGQGTIQNDDFTAGILNGPNGSPNAVGPTNNNDDFTNKSSNVPAGLVPGSTFNPNEVTFTNTVQNTGGAVTNISLLPSIPSSLSSLPTGTIVTVSYVATSATYNYNGSQFVFTGGTGVVGGNPVSGSNPVRIDSIAVNGTANYGVTVDLPAGTSLSTDVGIERGFPVPITAFVDSNSNGIADDSVNNSTINRVYTGFLQQVKQSRILQGTGPAVQGTDGTLSTTPKQSAPGNIIEYVVQYKNVSEVQSGSGNVILNAGNVVITEDGTTLPNNWARNSDSNGVIDTSHVLGSAQGAGVIQYFSGDPATNLLGGEQNGTTANSDVTKYINTLTGIVAPGALGTLIFQRKVNEPSETLTLSNNANATYEDQNTPNVPINGTSNSVSGDVAVTPITKIHDIQGSSSSSPLANATVTIEGIVVGDFEGASPALRGFYVQEEDADADADPATSEGIFVFNNNNNSVAIGDKVQLTGTVAEFQGQTQVTTTTVTIVSSGNLLPTAASVSLPFATTDYLERFEGMRVTFPQNLIVTNNFPLGRFGTFEVSSGDRLFQPTQVASPGATANTLQVANNLNRILIDDSLQNQNPDPVIFPIPSGLSASNTLRGGTTVSNLAGVLTYTWGGNAASPNAYRVRPTPTDLSNLIFTDSNPRPATPPSVGGTLRVASANLLNFFNGNGIDANSDGLVDGGFPTSRGADTAIEFKRQIDKTVQAVLGANADVFGYNEMENDGYGTNSAVQQLVNALNAATAPGTYAFVTPPASALMTANGVSDAFGGDEITVGFIYKTNAVRVAPGTSVAALTTGIFAQDSANRVQRPALAVTFERLANGTPTNETFTSVINHFKSKGSAANLPSDADQGDGQGLSNATRTQAAQELATWLATKPTGTTDSDYLIMGDLNSYRLEDPITTLINAGYTSLFDSASYSYQFDGQWGSLDHALASNSLNSQVTGAAKWHINADEPIVLDYNTEFKTAGQIDSFYNVDPFRTSDHDPVIIGLDLRPSIYITEYMYDGQPGEFVEFTNEGSTAVDFTGWSFDDSSRASGSFNLSAFGIVLPGESVILTEANATAFRTAWNLPSEAKIIGGLTQNLGRNDEINLYDASGNLVDRLTYNDQGSGNVQGPRTQNASAWPSLTALGANNASQWTLSTTGDAEKSRSNTATTAALGSPGVSTFGQPAIYNLTPDDNGTGFAPANNLVIDFTEQVQKGTGSITIYRTSDDSVVETFDIATSPLVSLATNPDTTISNSRLTINPTSDLELVTGYYVQIASTAIKDVANVDSFSGIADKTTWNFTTSAGAIPTISLNIATTTNFLDGGVLVAPTSPLAISGVVNDPTDPARTIGLDFDLADSDTPLGNLTVTATSSNQSVVLDANLNLTGSNGDRNLKITPTDVGLTDITVTVSDGLNSTTYTINYGASAASVNPSTTRFHTGASDASTALAIDADYMLVADDEDQTIRLYDRNDSGLPLKGFDFTSSLGLSGSSEVDIEASTRNGNTIYWMGSHSNNSSGDDRPNRERIFSTTLSSTGVNTALTFNGYYSFLEDDLIAWDNNNGHGLGSGFLGLAASAANGVIPEQSNGFNIEGLTFVSGTIAYLGFRAPIEPTSNRTQALIVPVTNFTTIAASANGGTTGSATFGSPIFLDLGGRGIRSIERSNDGSYLIVAGTAGAGNDFRIYSWSGNVNESPVDRGVDLTALISGGSFESIVEVPASLASTPSVQLLVDNGDTIWYNNGTISKDLPATNQQKFRSEVVTLNVLNHAPTDIDLSNGNINENVPANTIIGNFSTTDPDTGNTFTYSLVTGLGDTDNSAFTIDGNQLKINNSPDFETKSSYSIRVKTTDQGGLSYEEEFSIKVLDAAEKVTTPNRDSINTGPGNDFVTTTLDNLRQRDSINGGAGNDTLVLNGLGSTTPLEINLSNASQVLVQPNFIGLPIPFLFFPVPWSQSSVKGFENVDASGFTGNLNLTGSNLSQTLKGGSGADRILGLGGDDLIDGGLGADELTGGLGNDMVYLGNDSARDKVYYNPGDGMDTVFQFNRANDQIIFSGIANINVQTVGSNTELRDQANNLLMTLTGTTGFTSADVGASKALTGGIFSFL